MDGAIERLNRVLDAFAAERDPANRVELTADEVALAQTAAFLKTVARHTTVPRDAFLDRLAHAMDAMTTGHHAPG